MNEDGDGRNREPGRTRRANARGGGSDGDAGDNLRAIRFHGGGPIWHPRDAHLTFSDIPANKIYRWSETGGVSVYREPSHKANGNTYDRTGRMLTCEHATSRVVRDDGGAVEVIASHYQGKELNSPNDIVVRSDGAIFFTDPTYGRNAGPTGIERDPELDFRGVYQITPIGELKLLASDFNMPNGLCLSLDEQELFVADTPERHVRRFRIDGDRFDRRRRVLRLACPGRPQDRQPRPPLRRRTGRRGRLPS